MDITFSKEWENSFLEKMGKFYYPRKYSILERMAKTHSVFMNGNWTFKNNGFYPFSKECIIFSWNLLNDFWKIIFFFKFYIFLKYSWKSHSWKNGKNKFSK